MLEIECRNLRSSTAVDAPYSARDVAVQSTCDQMGDTKLKKSEGAWKRANDILRARKIVGGVGQRCIR